jgi:two-component system LytT family response regulator
VTGDALRLIVVDDDPRARERIRALASSLSGVSIVAECGDGVAAVEALKANAVDAVFLDVDMPRLDGFGVISKIGVDKMPPIVFVSAFSEFAVRAFEAYAVDYLLKPYEDERFAKAIERLRTAPAAKSESDPRVEALVADAADRGRRTFPVAIAVKSGSRYLVVRLPEVNWFEADGSHVRVHVAGRTVLMARSLNHLETELLDPRSFIRVHRSAIVAVHAIVAAEPSDHGDLTLIMKDGARVACSRRFRDRLQRELHFTA